jgi:hypothetical protein
MYSSTASVVQWSEFLPTDLEVRVRFSAILDSERGPLSLVSKIDEQLGGNSSGSGLEIREYSRGDPLD